MEVGALNWTSVALPTSPRISGVPEIRFGKPKSGIPDLGRGEVERSEGEGVRPLRIDL